MQSIFEVLKQEDIDEKIRLNMKDWGYTLQQLKEKLEDELAHHERIIIKLLFDYTKLPEVNDKTYKGHVMEILPYQIQTQNLKEQIRHINNRILKGETLIEVGENDGRQLSS